MTAVYNKIIWNILATTKLKVLVIDFKVYEWLFIYLFWSAFALVCFFSLNYFSVLFRNYVFYISSWTEEAWKCDPYVDLLHTDGWWWKMCPGRELGQQLVLANPKWPQRSTSQSGINEFKAQPWKPIKKQPIWNLLSW